MELGTTAARHVSPVRYRPPRSVPLHTAVGTLESGEFHRQAGLIRDAWPHCAGSHLALEDLNHFTVVEALGDPASPLRRHALRMMRLA